GGLAGEVEHGLRRRPVEKDGAAQKEQRNDAYQARSGASPDRGVGSQDQQVGQVGSRGSLVSFEAGNDDTKSAGHKHPQRGGIPRSLRVQRMMRTTCCALALLLWPSTPYA